MIHISNTKEHSLAELLTLSFNFIKQNLKVISLSAFFLITIPYYVMFQLPLLFPNLSLLSENLIIVTSIIFIYIALNLLKSKDKSIKSIFYKKNILSTLLKIIYTDILRLVLLIGLFFLLVIPCLIFANYWIFGLFIAIDKRIYGKKALDYSKKLVKKHWWKIFFIVTIFILPNMITTSLITFYKMTSYYLPLAIVTSIITIIFHITFIIMYINLDQIFSTKKTK